MRKLLKIFIPKADTAKQDTLKAGLIKLESPAVLLVEHQALLSRIKGLIGVPEAHWQKLYLTMFHSYAGFVQKLPASEAHHHCYEGGLLIHGLEVVYETLRLRRAVLLPVGADAETLGRLQDVWTYGCVTGALLHDLAKPLTDQEITLFNNAQEIGVWQPITGAIPENATAYRPRYRANRLYSRHERLAPLLAHLIVPKDGLAWLTLDAELLDYWACAIQGDWENAGALGELISKADSISTAQDLVGSSRIQLTTSRAKPLASRLLQTLKHLLHEQQIPLNRKGAAGFYTEQGLWLVSKRVLDDVRKQMQDDGQTGIPTGNDRLMDELQQNGIIAPCGDKAIWKCEVIEGDWKTSLTLLKIDAAKIWPDPSRRPELFAGQVIADPEALAASEKQEAPEEHEKHEIQQATPVVTEKSSTPKTPETEPVNNELEQTPQQPKAVEQQPAATLDGLILPFDLPVDVSSASEEPATPATKQKVEIEVGSEDSENHAEPVIEVTEAFEAVSAEALEEDLDEAADSEEFESAKLHKNAFVAWLQESIRTGREPINVPNARIHTVDEGLLIVSPGIFKDFNKDKWLDAQTRFAKLKLHQAKSDGTGIWHVKAQKAEGGRRASIIKVMWIPDAASKLDLTLPPSNPNLTLLR